MSPGEFTTSDLPDRIEYRKEVPGVCIYVIQVFTRTEIPRITAFSQRVDENIPLSLFLDEILAFAQDALSRRGRTLDSGQV